MTQPAETRLRYFTPGEANALIPRLKEFLQDLGERAQVIRERVKTFNATRSWEAGSRQRAMAEIEALQAEVREVLAEIGRLGVEVKGLEPALLDFPALRHGQEVLLCWREDESEVLWWHPMDTGFGGREFIEDASGAAWQWCH